MTAPTDSSQPQAPQQRFPAGALVAVLVATLLWGGSFPVSKYALQQLSPLALASLRFTLAAVLYTGVLMVGRRRYPTIAIRDWPMLVGLSLLGVTLHFWIQYTAVALTTATHAALLIATAPIWVIILARLWTSESLGRLRWLGTAVSYAGVALIVLGSGATAGVATPVGQLRGDVLMVFDAGVWALFTVLGRTITRRYPPFLVTAWVGIIGCIGLLPLGIGSGLIEALPDLDMGTWLAVLFLAGPCTLLGYGGWYYALSRVDASRIAPFQYLQPLYAAVIAAFLLGEVPGWNAAAGGVLIIGGLRLASQTTGSNPPPAKAEPAGR
jgi:drug/metabolite transporter (DMT)-like permease